MNRSCRDCGIADHAPCECERDYPTESEEPETDQTQEEEE